MTERNIKERAEVTRHAPDPTDIALLMSDAIRLYRTAHTDEARSQLASIIRLSDTKLRPSVAPDETIARLLDSYGVSYDLCEEDGETSLLYHLA